MGDSCSADGFEYHDPFDAMGSGDIGSGTPVVRQMSMQHKLALHLLPASAVKVVGVTGTYRLAPMETLTRIRRAPAHPQGRRRQLLRRVPPADRLLRQPPTPLSGVLIRTESPEIYSNPSDPNADTALIDMHPASFDDWTDAAMDVGQTFSDPLHSITIQDCRAGRHRCDAAITCRATRFRRARPAGSRPSRAARPPSCTGTPHRRFHGRRLRRRARRRAGRDARHDRLHRHGPRAGHEGRATRSPRSTQRAMSGRPPP